MLWVYFYFFFYFYFFVHYSLDKQAPFNTLFSLAYCETDQGSIDATFFLRCFGVFMIDGWMDGWNVCIFILFPFLVLLLLLPLIIIIIVVEKALLLTNLDRSIYLLLFLFPTQNNITAYVSPGK